MMQTDGPPEAAKPEPAKGLGSIARRGAVLTMGGQFLTIAIQVGGLIVLARLLSPQDYGMLAMVLAVIGVGEVLREFGLSSATVQAASVTHQQRTNLFWINTGIGLGLSLATVLCAPLIAGFYHTPALLPMTQALAITFVVNGIATQYRAQLNRDMRFGRLAICTVSGQATGLAIGVVMALEGFGHWALVGQQVGFALSMLIFFVLAGRWMPGLPRRCAGMGEFLRYGWNLMLSQIIVYFSRNVDSMVIGERFGANALGFYNRAYQLVMLPLYQITSPAGTVALPILSRLRNDPKRYDDFLLAGQAALLHAIFAILAFACAQAHALVDVILGERWMPMATLFQLLCIGGMFQAATNATYWVFLSKGLTGTHFRFTAISKPLLIAGIIVGANWGVMGVAIAQVIGLGLTWLAALAWLRGTGSPVRKLFTDTLLLLVGYGFCGLAAGAVPWLLHLSGIAAIAAGAGVMIAAFGLLYLVSPHFRGSVKAVFRTMAIARSAGKG